jgi:hypothetical protein
MKWPWRDIYTRTGESNDNRAGSSLTCRKHDSDLSGADTVGVTLLVVRDAVCGPELVSIRSYQLVPRRIYPAGAGIETDIRRPGMFTPMTEARNSGRTRQAKLPEGTRQVPPRP